MQDLAPLRNVIRSYGRVLVCYSGGLDSTMLLNICMEELGKDAFAFTADVPMMSKSMKRQRDGVSRALGIAPYVMKPNQSETARIYENTEDRCLQCKRAIYSMAGEVAKEIGASHILCGDNADDLSSDRPGMKAAAEFGVKSPLRESGITRQTVKEYVESLNLPFPMVKETCLLMRYRPGIPINQEDILRSEVIDARIRFATEVTQLRARINEGVLEVQTSSEDIPKILENKEKISKIADGFGLSAVFSEIPYDQ